MPKEIPIEQAFICVTARNLPQPRSRRSDVRFAPIHAMSVLMASDGPPLTSFALGTTTASRWRSRGCTRSTPRPALRSASALFYFKRPKAMCFGTVLRFSISPLKPSADWAALPPSPSRTPISIRPWSSGARHSKTLRSICMQRTALGRTPASEHSFWSGDRLAVLEWF